MGADLRAGGPRVLGRGLSLGEKPGQLRHGVGREDGRARGPDPLRFVEDRAGDRRRIPPACELRTDDRAGGGAENEIRVRELNAGIG